MEQMDSAAVDVPTLRRIALLALRISQDEPSLGRPMGRISAILEQMKREAALGQPFDRAEVDHLKRLLTRAARPGAADSVISGSMLAELRDLGRALPAD
jgi:hypothetical protein